MDTDTLHLWRWRITDDRGRRISTRHLMTEADALATDPTAERIPGTEEVRKRGTQRGHADVGSRRGPTDGGVLDP